MFRVLKTRICTYFFIFWVTVFISELFSHVNCRAFDNHKSEFTVATYNIWNIMFNWEIRKSRTVQMIKETSPDIVALQEVRSDGSGDSDQVQELKQLLTVYKWHLCVTFNKVIPHGKVYNNPLNYEGIGLLSKYPILNHTLLGNPQQTQYYKDKNHRRALHVVIDMGQQTPVNVIVVHFTTNVDKQCMEALNLQQYYANSKLRNLIVLGDFNTYAQWEGPISLFTGEKPRRKCPMQRFPNADLLKDAWKVAHPSLEGLTFSNMPNPGRESRPDRVLVTDDFQITNAIIFGDGKVYQEKFYFHVLWNRMENVIGAMYDASVDVQGRSCNYDCGPNASCRCGVCVAVGDKNTCDLPNCEECSKTHFHYSKLKVFVMIYSILCIQLLYAVLRVMHKMNRRRGDVVKTFFGMPCCLCNPEMYNIRISRPWSVQPLRNKILYCKYIPPMHLLILTGVQLAVLTMLFMNTFNDALHDITAIIPEELFPSDHLMLVVSLNTK